MFGNKNLLLIFIMSTFQHHSQVNKKKQSISSLDNQNDRLIKTLSLTQKGLNQAHRNDSKEIWKLFHDFQEETQAQTQRQYQHSQSCDLKGNKHFERSPQQYQNLQLYKQSKKDQQTQIEQIKSHSKNQTNSKSTMKKKRDKNLLKQEKSKVQESYQQKKKQSRLKKMNEQIAKHLQNQKYCTRELSNSAFAKLYNRPCIQAYGYKNTSKYSQTTKNLLKTHNITPHTNQNNPQTYQAYANAIKNAKRTKLSEQNKQQRIRRQFLKWFDDSIVQEAQLELNQLNKQKRDKSLENLRVRKTSSLEFQEQNAKIDLKQKRKSLKELLKSNEPLFVYKYKESDGSVKLAKDRHGLTCYIDSSFSDNQKALLDFEIKRNPILPDQVKPQDTNLDKIRRQNYQKSIQQSHPGHYMIPCVVTPYDRSKYQFRKSKAQSTNN